MSELSGKSEIAANSEQRPSSLVSTRERTISALTRSSCEAARSGNDQANRRVTASEAWVGIGASRAQLMQCASRTQRLAMGSPARLTTAVQPAMDVSQSEGPTNVTLRTPTNLAWADDGLRVRTFTRAPWLASLETSRCPMSPVAPVIATVSLLSLPAAATIHRLRIREVRMQLQHPLLATRLWLPGATPISSRMRLRNIDIMPCS